jgi:cell division protein FtsL
MVAYIRGSLAVDERKVRRAPVQEQRRQVTRKKASIPPQEKLLYMVTILVCVIVAVFIVSGYAKIYEVNTQIKDAKKELQQLEQENSTLSIQKSKLGGLEQMQKTGEETGLQLASDDELIKIHVPGTETLSTSQTAVAR